MDYSKTMTFTMIDLDQLVTSLSRDINNLEEQKVNPRQHSITKVIRNITDESIVYYIQADINQKTKLHTRLMEELHRMTDAAERAWEEELLDQVT